MWKPIRNEGFMSEDYIAWAFILIMFFMISVVVWVLNKVDEVNSEEPKDNVVKINFGNAEVEKVYDGYRAVYDGSGSLSHSEHLGVLSFMVMEIHREMQDD
jgi:hypothetical protein